MSHFSQQKWAFNPIHMLSTRDNSEPSNQYSKSYPAWIRSIPNIASPPSNIRMRASLIHFKFISNFFSYQNANLKPYCRHLRRCVASHPQCNRTFSFSPTLPQMPRHKGRPRLRSMLWNIPQQRFWSRHELLPQRTVPWLIKLATDLGLLRLTSLRRNSGGDQREGRNSDV